MATKVYCDLCGEFIAEYGVKSGHESPQLNRPYVISTGYVGKSLYDEHIGWSGRKERFRFWACKECNKKFMVAIRTAAKELGLK